MDLYWAGRTTTISPDFQYAIIFKQALTGPPDVAINYFRKPYARRKTIYVFRKLIPLNFHILNEYLGAIEDNLTNSKSEPNKLNKYS